MKNEWNIIEILILELVDCWAHLVKYFDLKFHVKKNQFFLRLTKLHSFINSNF